MPRPYVFPTDTTLYHVSEGKRVFPAGETDPGAAWTDKPGGEPADKGTTKQAMRDLVAAQDQIDGLGAQLARKDHDLAVMASERDAATGKVADLEQRVVAAETAQFEAETAARDYMQERDSARSELQAAKDALGAAETAHGEKAADLMAQLDAAKQALADANGQIETLTAPKKSGKADAAPADTAPGA